MSTPDLPRDSHGDGDDIDAEFARLTEGLDIGADAPTEASAAERADAPADADEDFSSDAPLTVEDLLAQTDQADDQPTMAVIAPAVASAKALAGAIRLGVEAREDDARIPDGARTYDGEFGALVIGALREKQAHELAAVVSTALQRNGIVLFWRRGERMTATRYRDGERGEDVSPALVLGAVDPAVEQLVLGTADPAQLGEGYAPAALSREEALTYLEDGKKKRWRWR